jgi:hypothetical protein
MDEALVIEKLFFVMKNLYDVVGLQQQGLDVIAGSHFKLADIVRNAVGLESEGTPPPSASQSAIDQVGVEIAELERLFKKGKS